MWAATCTGLALLSGASAQVPPPTPALAALLTADSGLRWRSIGPSGPGARVDDFAVDPARPARYYVGFATSGVWRTTNNGTTFDPIFDQAGVSTIGALAVAPSRPSILYVGTGEANHRQSSSPGRGMFRTLNADAPDPADVRFEPLGLTDTESIARIVVHPTNPDIVWVAAMGHLYGPNEERGVFLTTNGGQTWTRTLFVDASTGATDLIIDPSNPLRLWAATYTRQRTAWGLVGGGPGSGLHVSADGGRTWTRLTGRGLPAGQLGRIGLTISASKPDVVYAQIEVGFDPGAGSADEAEDEPVATAPPLRAPPNPRTNGLWRSDDAGGTWRVVSNENQRAMYFSQVRVDPTNPDIVYTAGITAMRSLDGGRTFQPLQGLGHVDHHAIWIDPADPSHLLYGNDGGFDVSYDQGRTWEALRLQPAAQSYHVSADERHPYRVCTGLQDNGSWCGPSSSRTGRIPASAWFRVGTGDGFQSQFHPTDDQVLYVEAQNGSLVRHDLAAGRVTSIRPTASGRGPGVPPNIVQVPAGTPGPLQFNWNTPLRLSREEPDTVLLAGRHLFISRNRGDTWAMSEPLGKGIDVATRAILGQPYNRPICGAGSPTAPCILSRHDGLVSNEYGTATELAESPVSPLVLWVGTDDGNVQVSRDGGTTFTEVGRHIPGVNHEYYVSGLEASWFAASTAYVALDGHRHDDPRPYLFKTTDYGRNWQPLAAGLPAWGHINSVRQDPENRSLLYVATETGIHASLDDGETWTRLMPNLPDGRVDELLVHPREHDLIAATHGRGIWILDDVSALQGLTPEVRQRDAVLFKPRDAVDWAIDRRQVTETVGDKWWFGENAPNGTALQYYLRVETADIRVDVQRGSTTLFACRGSGRAGLHRVAWTGIEPDSGPLPAAAPMPCGPGPEGTRPGTTRLPEAGEYRVTLRIGGRAVQTQTFRVVEDRWLNER